MTRQPNGSASSEPNLVDVSMDGTAADDDQLLPNILTTSPSLTDAVFAHFSRNLPIREVLQLRAVSKQFAALISENKIFTLLARLQDDSKDWYFPLLFTTHTVCATPYASAGERKRWSSWKWYGVHHPTKQAHTLPSLEHLPFNSEHLPYIKILDPSLGCIIGTTGSLLLFLLQSRKDMILWRAWNDRNLIHRGFRSPWIPLLVSNPLTQEYTELPAPANEKSVWHWDYHGARVHLVEDERVNAYTVVILFRDRVLVYKSTSKCWTSSVFEESISWGCRGTDLIPDVTNRGSAYYDVPHAFVGGKLFYAELEVDGNTMATALRDNGEILDRGGVRVFEVDYNGGTWKRAVRLSLRRSIPQDLPDSVSAFGFEIGSYGIEVVNCMGGLYILIPASLDVSTRVAENILNLYNLKDGARRSDKTYEDFGFLPLRFYVLQVFKGDHGLAFGQALIQLPLLYDRGLIRRSTELYKNPLDARSRNSWYRARGVGTMVNIMVGTYLVEYDVVSGVTTTQVIGYSSVLSEEPDVAYRPCLYRNP